MPRFLLQLENYDNYMEENVLALDITLTLVGRKYTLHLRKIPLS